MCARCSKFKQRSFILSIITRIKSLITLKSVASNVPTVFPLDNGDNITSPYDIANNLNNYFAFIAETTKKTKYSHKHFSDYLANENGNTIFLQPTDKEEIAKSYLLSTLIRLLAQIVYLIEYYCF